MERMGVIMAECSYCNGSGIEVYDDEYDSQSQIKFLVESDCYHCGGTGSIDDDTAFHDCLESVATIMAQAHVDEFKKRVNQDPDGEDFAFMAAENMATPFDFERCLVYSYVGEFMKRLGSVPFETQREYVRKMYANEAIEPLYE